MSNKTVMLYAPDIYPTNRIEMRAYTIAAFRVAQQSDQLSLVPMSKEILIFLMKERAIAYWKGNQWLEETDNLFKLSASGLVLCQSALAAQLPTHNTTATNTEYWEAQFRTNTHLSRRATFSTLQF